MEDIPNNVLDPGTIELEDWVKIGLLHIVDGFAERWEQIITYCKVSIYFCKIGEKWLGTSKEDFPRVKWMCGKIPYPAIVRCAGPGSIKQYHSSKTINCKQILNNTRTKKVRMCGRKTYLYLPLNSPWEQCRGSWTTRGKVSTNPVKQWGKCSTWLNRFKRDPQSISLTRLAISFRAG